MDNSLFVESLKMILEESNQFSVMMDNTYYVQEGKISEFLKKIDIKKIFTYIFNKFIDIIKNIWNQFRALYQSFTAKNALLKRYKKKLENVDWEIEYPEERYHFTNLDNSGNINLYKMSLSKEYDEFNDLLNRMSKRNDMETIYSYILSFRNNMAPLDEFLNQKRGQSIGKNFGISKEDYLRELNSYFISEKKIAPGIIYPNEIKYIMKEYYESKTVENTITKDKNSLLDSSKDMLSKINSIDLNKRFPDTMNKDIYNTFTEIIREYCNRIQGICNIYVQLFSTKLDMFKLYKQDQAKILSKIIIESIRGGKM